MATRLIATKLYVPTGPKRGLVGRPRLHERLERGAEARLTLVSAPAGFGKTTLLAAWLGASRPDRAVAWLSLDAADNEPATFWTYVVTALEAAVPGVGTGARELLGPVPAVLDSFVTALLNELAAAPRPVWLVLDDYHLIDDHEIRDGIAFLLEHLPAQAHVVLITRADPDLPLARWRVRDELTEIRAADLRFTGDEATAYFDTMPGVVLEAGDVAVLEERTEGWIAALQLAALSLQGRTDVSGFIAQFAGDDRYVVDYLIDEVLQHQPDATRAFLLQTSVLDRLCGPLCDAVTGGGTGADTLVALERANLFTAALDDRREWYRYHHLFLDVLRARLLHERADEVALLHRRASQWYESQDLSETAITHALAGRDFDRAGRLMELVMPAVRRDRRDATMYGWLQALPDETVRRSPVLSVFHGSMLMASGELDVAEGWLDDAERALAAVADGQAPGWADTDELRRLPATIAVYRASLAQVRGDVDGTTEHARCALELAGPGDHLARGGAAGFLGLAAWTRGDVTTALGAFTDAVTSLTAAGTRVDELSSTVVLADLWLVAGRPTKARRLYEQALRRAHAWGPPVAAATAELEVGLSELDIEAGDLDSAGRHLDRAAALDGGTANRHRWFVARGLLALARGEPSEALELLEQAGRLYRPGFFPDVRPVPALKARIWLTQGRVSEAADWARERRLADADVSYLNEFDHLTLVRLLLAEHRADPTAGAADRAVGLLGRLHEDARTARRSGGLLEIGMLQALAHDARGNRARALEALEAALALVPEPEGYLRLFVAEGAPLLSLLRDAAPGGVVGDQVRRLVRAGASADPPSPTRRVAHAGAESLSSRELDVLRLLDGELTGPQIARRLFVTHNTVRTHTKHIFTKLDVTTRRMAVLRAHQRGLI